LNKPDEVFLQQNLQGFNRYSTAETSGTQPPLIDPLNMATLIHQSSAVTKTDTKPHDKWFYPAVVADDLASVDLPNNQKQELLNCARECARCLISSYTNWDRYIAFVRLGTIVNLAEFRGDLLDMASNDRFPFGYDLDMLLETMFGGGDRATCENLAREIHTYLLVTEVKTNKTKRGDSELFRRHVNVLTASLVTGFDCATPARSSDSLSLRVWPATTMIRQTLASPKTRWTSWAK
jgi:hypothetical protein